MFKFFTILSLITLLFTACSSQKNRTKEHREITIGFTSWPGFDIIYYAQHNGFFKKYGIDVKLVKYSDQATATKALENHQVDAAMISILDVLQLHHANNYTIILCTNVSNGADGIVAQKDISSIQDLQGKTISAQEESVNKLILYEALKSQNMSFEDVNIVDISNEEALPRLFHKTIDAAVLWEPLLGKAKSKIRGNIIFTTKDVNSLVIDTLVVSNISLKKDADIWENYLFVWYDLMHIIQKDRKEVMQVVGEITINPHFDADYAGLQAGTIKLNNDMFLNNRLKNSIKKIAKLSSLQDNSHIIVDEKFVTRAMKNYAKRSGFGSPK